MSREASHDERRIADRVVRGAIYGYVYVVQMEGYPWLKIGRTEHSDSEAVRRRVRTMQTGCPLPLQIVKEYPCENPMVLEHALHIFLARHRRHGEWFETTLEQIERLMVRAHYHPSLWREAVEQEQEARRVRAEVERARGAQFFADQCENATLERTRQRAQWEATHASEDAERARRIQADMRAFALARKKRRLGRRARTLGVLCCGLVVGVAGTVLVMMTSMSNGHHTSYQRVQGGAFALSPD